MNGFLCVDKPRGPSSFQVIHQLRRILGIKKIGHAGTLDPEASGLLVVALGDATRLLQYLPNEPKVYQFGIQFGTETDTLDSEGSVLQTGGIFPDKLLLSEKLSEFTGIQMQIPPAFSALKVNGVRAYDLARKGQNPDLKARKIEVYAFELLSYDTFKGVAELKVTCSGGTYVRALARDLSVKLGTFGFANYIRRISSGNFTLERSVGAETLSDAGKYIINSAEIFKDKVSIQVTENQKSQLIHGCDIFVPDLEKDETGLFFAYDADTLLAVLKLKADSTYHPVTVFLPGNQ